MLLLNIFIAIILGSFCVQLINSTKSNEHESKNGTNIRNNVEEKGPIRSYPNWNIDHEDEHQFVEQFMDDLEQKEKVLQKVMFPPPVIHPIYQDYYLKNKGHDDEYEREKLTKIGMKELRKSLSRKLSSGLRTISFKKKATHQTYQKIDYHLKLMEQKTPELALLLRNLYNGMSEMKQNKNNGESTEQQKGQLTDDLERTVLVTALSYDISMDELGPPMLISSNAKFMKELALLWFKTMSEVPIFSTSKSDEKEQNGKKNVKKMVKLFMSVDEHGNKFVNKLLIGNNSGRRRRLKRIGPAAIAIGLACVAAFICIVVLAFKIGEEWSKLCG